ncbi:MAG TPA: methyltransferase [Opitutaceae bacterium]|nr:methyltransferase [Opitutaceae bacterium]
MTTPPRERFLALVKTAIDEGKLVKLTLGKYRGADGTLKNIFVRPVTLKSGPQLTFVSRHDTRDITKNHPPAEALALIEAMLGGEFLDAHLFTTTGTAQFEGSPEGKNRLRIKANLAGDTATESSPAPHDRAKSYAIPADAAWLRALGVTNERGQPREGMADKFRQIQKFSELLSHLIQEAKLPDDRPLTVVDMGSGKGYLTFAIAALLRDRATVRGVESRPELVELCNRVAREQGFPHLSFQAGRIDSVAFENRDAKSENPVDALLALHACDTATDDALARGIAAGASLLVVSPCCQKELRHQLVAPAVLAGALQHGIFQERQAEFVTDALRAQLLEWAGYRTKVFEFISTEHTAKNLMIAAIKTHPAGGESTARRIREFAAFYGVRSQKLAAHLRFPLISPAQ